MVTEITRDQARREKARRLALNHFPSFFRLFPPEPEYIYGHHTLVMLDEIQQAEERFEQGESSYLIFNVPQRHGKSDIASRRLPVHHLIKYPRHEVIVATYGQQLARDMSLDARECYLRTAGVWDRGISAYRSGIDSWRTADGGAFHAVGMGGSGGGGVIIGRGGHLVIIDDYLKGRIEAESKNVRDKIWDTLRMDLFTRLAPVHIIIIVANRWHEDDAVGRIKNANNPKHKQYNPDFPKFRVIRFPAQDHKGDWLFPERYSEVWYRVMRGTVSQYGWDSQFQQDPHPRTGNLLKADLEHVKIVPPEDVPWNDLEWYRGWDLASSKKERLKEDPDYTAGVKAAYDEENDELWIAHVERGQWEAPERDRRIEATIKKDGEEVTLKIESVAGYKDTYTRFVEKFEDYANIEAVHPDSDKVARASVLESYFEQKKVRLVRGYWNDEFLEELSGFPYATHDDQVDGLVVAISDVIYAGTPNFSAL